MKTEDFITKANIKHDGKYDYSKVEYVNCYTKICIICPIHGEFWQTPHDHLRGYGCPKCSNKQHYNTEKWIEEAKRIHGDKYDYSKVEYVNSKTKVCIICPEHGEFWQTPYHHLHGFGCQKCTRKIIRNKQSLTVDDFVLKAKSIHCNKYNYSKVEYVNSKSKVCIICPKHGEFWQTPSNHLKGRGCPMCRNEQNSARFLRSVKDFITQSHQKHENKYEYSKVNYINCKTKVCIVCPKHGEFWQTPDCHLQGNGCPKCYSSISEYEIRQLLTNNNIVFDEQKHFTWLGQQVLDFYLPFYNIAIECQGIQHFEPVDYFGGINSLEDTKKRDQRKYELCKEHNIKVLYYANYNYNFPYNVITDIDILLDMIKNG